MSACSRSTRGVGLAALLLLGAGATGCSDLFEDRPIDLLLTPRSARISYAKADGSSWDGDLPRLSPLAGHFWGEEPPEGVSMAERNLFEGFDGAPDPFVEVFRETDLIMTTSVEPNNLLPYWDEEPVPVSVLPGTGITLRIWDRDEGLQDLIAEVELRGRDLDIDGWEIDFDLDLVRTFRLLITRP